MTSEQRDALAGVITVDKQVMHGTPCFTGTRVPVQTLLDFLETGETIDDFVQVFPYIPREQVVAFLELSKELTVQQISCVSSQTRVLIPAPPRFSRDTMSERPSNWGGTS